MKKNQLIILGVVLLAVASVLIAGWFGWKNEQKQQQHPKQQETSLTPATLSPAQETEEEVIPPGEVVFKCQNEGKTIYTDEPCPTGSTTGTMILRDAISQAVPKKNLEQTSPYKELPDSKALKN